jgi:flagellar hook-associated protein 2
MTVDDAKLTKALADNPQAVEAVLAGFAASLGAPSSNNTMTGVSGTPTIHQDGTYHVIVNDATLGTFDAKFVTNSGQTIWTATGTMMAGQDNYAVIPGLKITAPAVLTAGVEDTFSVTVTNKGVGVSLKDFVDNLLDPVDGYFAGRKKGDDAINNDYTKRIADMNDRLDQKQAALERKYSTLETTMSRLQSQSAQLAASLAKLNAG